MSALFTFRPYLQGWLVKADSPTVERDVSAIVGREVHVEDFPTNIAVVGHVAVGNTWIAILKPAGRAEFLGALLQRQEYSAFDPFKVVAELEGGQDVAQAIEAAALLPDSSTDAVVQPPRVPQDMFLLAGLSSYLPLAYAAFIRAPAAERRLNYWSFLPRRFALATYPLARFGELAARQFSPSTQASIAPTPHVVAPPGRPIAAAPVGTEQAPPPDVTPALARLARLEERVETLAKSKKSLTVPDNGSNAVSPSAFDNAINAIRVRLDNLEVRTDVVQETVGTAVKTSLRQDSEPTAGRRRLMDWIAGAVVAIVASVGTTGLLILVTRPDMLTHVERAMEAATRAEIAAERGGQAAGVSANIQLDLNSKAAQVTEAVKRAEISISEAATNAADEATRRVARAIDDALRAIAGAQTTATAAVTTAQADVMTTITKAQTTATATATKEVFDAGKKAASELATTQSTLTQTHGMMIACMTAIADAQIELAKAKTALQRETMAALLATAVKDAEGKCSPKP